jgi:hypothetical protein
MAQHVYLQPMMTLLFGTLTQDFVNFAAVLKEARAGNPDAQAGLAAAGAHFRHSASLNASYLVYIGEIYASLFPIEIFNIYISFLQVLACLSARLLTCIFGSTPAKSMPSASAKAIFVQFCGKTSNSLTKSVLVKSQLVFRPTPVCDLSFISFCIDILSRPRPTRHIGESGLGRQSHRYIYDWFHPCLYSFMEIGPRSYLNPAMYCPCWRCDEQVCFKIHPVCSSLIPGNSYLNPLSRISLQHVAEGGSLAEEVISTIRTAHAFGTQIILGRLYNAHADKARAVDMKAASWQGRGMAVLSFVIYGAYGLSKRHSLQRSPSA